MPLRTADKLHWRENFFGRWDWDGGVEFFGKRSTHADRIRPLFFSPMNSPSCFERETFRCVFMTLWRLWTTYFYLSPAENQRRDAMRNC